MINKEPKPSITQESSYSFSTSWIMWSRFHLNKYQEGTEIWEENEMKGVTDLNSPNAI